MNGVHDAVPRPRQPNAVVLRQGLQENVVVRRLAIHVEQIVIQIANGHLGLDPRNADAFKSEVRHNRVDIVRQRLVHLQRNIRARCHEASALN